MDGSSLNSSEIELSTTYSGEFDAQNLKTGIGEINWNRQCPQRYQGRVFQDCIHGRGRYTWIQNNEPLLYEGWFFANNLEGYGKFYYANTSVFEGLFKNNQRFGPGVYTHRDGTQDVGIWYGEQLIRLCNTVQPYSVPRLATTPSAKIKLLRYKKLVSVCEDNKDRAKETMKLLDSKEDVLKQSDKLYNIYVRNPQSRFFNTLAYEERYFCEKDCYIEVALTPSEEQTFQEDLICKGLSETAVEETHSIETTDNNAGFDTWSDFDCVCENPKQIRLNGIKVELQRAEELLRKFEWDLKIAKRRKQIACRRKKLVAGFQTTITAIFKEIKEKKDDFAEDQEFKSDQLKMLEELIAEDDDLRENKIIDERDFFEKKRAFQQNKLLEKPTGEYPVLNMMDQDQDRGNESIENLLNEESLCGEDEYEEESEEIDSMLINEKMDYESACKLLEFAYISHKNVRDRVNGLIEKLIVETEKVDELECDKPPSKRILISDLLAWNNGNLSIEIMKHTFLYRNFENTSPFCISDILVGDRSTFRSHGKQEDACICYLTACSTGDAKKVIEYIYKHDLNPDVCDSKGNTGIIFAASQDQVKVMKRLVNLGANVDVFNDECFTPLGLCVTRYLAEQKDVNNWERAFLKPSFQTDISTGLEWRSHMSIASFNQFRLSNRDNLSQHSKTLSDIFKLDVMSDIFGDSMDILPGSQFLDAIIEMSLKMQKVKTSESDQQYKSYYQNPTEQQTDQTYILDLECVLPKEPKETKEAKGKPPKKDKAGASPKKSPIPEVIQNKLEPVKPESVLSPEELKKQNRLECIYKTILFLLDRRSNPNVCEVPIPTLILSIYTSHKEMIENILNNKANPNVATIEEHLTSLHVAVAHPPSADMLDIVKLLLEYNANPNCRTNDKHWPVEKEKLIGKKYQLKENDLGKTPLHLLSMRYDFRLDAENYLQQMALELIYNGGCLKAHYLGHTPLSIAMLRGNKDLIQKSLETQQTDPNYQLGESMGVLLTVYILQRYSENLPTFDVCEAIINLLITYNANPFNLIGEFGNTIDFMLLEDALPQNGKTKDKAKGEDKKGAKGKKENTHDLVKKHIETVAKDVLDRHLKGWIIKHLYDFVEEQYYYDETAELLAKFVTVKESIDLTQKLVYSGKIPLTEDTYDNVFDLIEFIINATSKPRYDGTAPSSQVDIDELLEQFELKAKPVDNTKVNVPAPESENHSDKYEVCYECLRKKDRQLFICDECKLIYFCSVDCNKNNSKQKRSIHVCNSLFYKRKFDLYTESVKRVEKLQEDKELLPKDDPFGVAPREIETDETKRLHLTRSIKCGAYELSNADMKLFAELLKKYGFKEAKRMFELMMKAKLGSKGAAAKVGGAKEKDLFAGMKDSKGGRIGKGGESNGMSKGKAIGRENGKGGDDKKKSSKGKGGKSDEAEGKSPSGKKKGKGGKADDDEHGSPSGKKKRKGSKADDDEHGSPSGKKKGKGGKADDDEDGFPSEKKKGKGGKADDDEGGSPGRKKKGKGGKGNKDGQDEDESPHGRKKGKGDGEEKESKSHKKKGKEDYSDSDVNKSKSKGGKKGGKEGESRGAGTKGGSVPKRAKSGGRKSRSEERTETRRRSRGQSKGRGVSANERSGERATSKDGKSRGHLKFSDNVIGNLEHMGRLERDERLMELKRRLPAKYQYFLEKLAEFWPDFDISMLFLPYACYSDGQLYYRFLLSKPIFMETFSNV